MLPVFSARNGAVKDANSQGSSSRRPRLLLVLWAGLVITPWTGASEESPPANVPSQAAAVPSDAGTPADDQAKRARRSEEIVVTATRSERSAADVPVSVTIVPREVIEKTPSRTLDDVLRTVVGLNLPLGSSNLITPTTNHVSMRGLGGDKVLVLLDGVPLNDPSSGYVQWNKAPLGTVERVEVARGAASSLFGNYAMGGTLNIVSRPLDESRLEADASYGTFDTRRLSASVTENLGSGLNAGVFLDTEDTDGYIRTLPQDRGKLDIPTHSRAINLQVKAEATGDSGSRVFVRGNVLDHDVSQGTPLADSPRRIYDVAAGGRFPMGAAEVSATAFYQDGLYTVNGSQFVPGAGRDAEYLGSITDRPESDLGGSLQWSRGIGGFLSFVSAGLDVRHIFADEFTTTFDRSGKQTGVRTSRGTQTFAGLFAEASFLPLPRLEVLLSARVDTWKNTGGREELIPGGITRYEDKSTSRFDPRLSLRYALNDVFALRGAVYQAFRAPNLRELYRGNKSLSLQTLPNPELGPETLDGGDLGVDVTTAGFRGQLNVFLNQVDGLIARAVLASTPTLVVQSRNLGSVRSQGVELMGTLALGRTVSLDAGYAFTDSVVTDNPADPSLVGKMVPDVPRHAGSLAVRWASPAWPSVTLRGRAQSHRFGDDANLLAMDAHVVMDLLVSHPLTSTLEVFASVENLLDRQYVSDVNLGRRLGPPLGVFAGLRLRQPLPPLGATPKSR